MRPLKRTKTKHIKTALCGFQPRPCAPSHPKWWSCGFWGLCYAIVKIFQMFIMCLHIHTHTDANTYILMHIVGLSFSYSLYRFWPSRLPVFIFVFCILCLIAKWVISLAKLHGVHKFVWKLQWQLNAHKYR